MKLAFKFCLMSILLSSSSLAEACSVCFGGDPESPMLIGLKWGIFLLLGVLSGILVLLGMFFLNTRKRSKLA
ncbi:MAG: hypothetical protein AB7F70_10500 [Candidatus Omnitrophota bacterium]